jgi:UDP-glucose 4-epimerase
MRLLVTGGAGFIGSHFVRRAVANGWRVTVLDDFSTGRAENLAGLDIYSVVGSVTDPAAVKLAMTEADTVVHLAALVSAATEFSDPGRAVLVNTLGTHNVIEAARETGISHIVFASSSAVYGNEVPLPTPESATSAPISPYGASKLAAENLLSGYARSFGVPVLILRLFNVYGPAQQRANADGAVIPVFLDAMRHGRSLPVDGDGGQSRDFTYVGTVTDVLLQAAGRGVVYPTPVNLALGTHTTIKDLITVIGDVTGQHPRVLRRPVRTGDIRKSQADVRLLTSLFPNVVGIGLRDGLSHTWRGWTN